MIALLVRHRMKPQAKKTLVMDAPGEASITLGNIDDYSIVARVGRGKYSNVFEGVRTDGSRVIIKSLKPVRQDRIFREIGILNRVSQCPHCCKLLDVVMDPDSKCLALILSYTENIDHKSLYQKLGLEDIKVYMHQLLEAVASCHSLGIMHRDIKPINIMIDVDKKEVSLIDWGLADYYEDGKEYPVRVATRQYKPPELLLNYGKYDYSIDIWCLGCTFASMILKIDPLFRSKDNDDQLHQIVKLFGYKSLKAFCKKYNCALSPENEKKMKKCRGCRFSSLVTEENEATATPEAIDLLQKMLVFDFEGRITASDALNHPFFDSIREL